MANKIDFSIGVLCYNEEDNIITVLNNLEVFLFQNSKLRFEVIIVDDCSSDNSINRIKEFIKDKYEFSLIIHESNKGIGGALRSIYEEAKGQIVTSVPGDGQFNVFELQPFLNFEHKRIVNLYRVENENYNFFRNGLSYLNRKINKYFLGLDFKDINWILIFDGLELQRVKPFSLSSSLITSEICAKMIYNNCHVIETQSRYLTRKYGKSKGASFKIVFLASIELFKLIYSYWKYKMRLKENK